MTRLLLRISVQEFQTPRRPTDMKTKQQLSKNFEHSPIDRRDPYANDARAHSSDEIALKLVGLAAGSGGVK
jgi:hypothetical protein